jgi:RND superfamily putative drug exporter
VLALWIVLLVAATLGHRAVHSSYSDDFSLPGSQSQQALTLLRQHQPTAGGQSAQIVFAASSGSLSAESSAIGSAVHNVATLPHVLSISDPLSPATTSKGGQVAYATVQFDQNPVKLGSSLVRQVDSAVAPARSAGVRVDYGGPLGQAARPAAKDALSELIGIVVAIVVLLIGFGSALAAGLPVVSALLGVFTGLGVLGMVAATTTFASVSPTLAIMMGLGVGIDYAVFLTTRHRHHLMSGSDPIEAAADTVATSGRAVLTAAITVVIAMLGLYASGIAFIGKLGLAAAITVAVAGLAALTLVPALVGIAGRSIDRLHVRAPVAEAGPALPGGDGAADSWHRYARSVGAHPWRYLLAGLSVLVILAIPVLSMELGHIGPQSEPASYTDKRAYDEISRAFGPGTNGPFTIVVQLAAHTSPSTTADVGKRADSALAATPGVASVAPFTASSDGALLYATLIPTTGPQSPATDTLLTTLRDRTLPNTLDGAGARGYVTGTTSAQLDFRNQVSARLPVIIAVVIAAAFLLLLVSFRSPVLALKAAVLNLFSIGAAFGVIVAVFQWGWGGSALGVSSKVPIESYVPMMMFAIVFGLSMDYEVFLLSRVREAWLRTGDDQASVADGLASTARVITCAALIMTSVFLAFLLSSSVVIKLLALGLGLSVLIDASIIRLLVVPATMFLLGRGNWWIPAWLDRILPHLDPEGGDSNTPTKVPVASRP